MNDFTRDLFSFSTYINYFQIIIGRYASKSIGLKIVLFPLFILCLLILLVAITPVFAIGLLVKLFFDILIDDLIDKGSGFAILAYLVFMEFFILMFLVLIMELILYGLLKLLSLGLGKTNNEGPIEAIYQVNDNKNEEKEDKVYVIDEDNFK